MQADQIPGLAFRLCERLLFANLRARHHCQMSVRPPIQQEQPKQVEHRNRNVQHQAHRHKEVFLLKMLPHHSFNLLSK